MIIDPYNFIDHKYDSHLSETNYISQLLTKLTAFAKAYQVHVVLIAHPTKIQKDEGGINFKVPSLYDIAGSANFYNKTDNGVIIWRDFESNRAVAYIQKIRFKWIGQVGSASFEYQVDNGCYKSVDSAPPPPFLNKQLPEVKINLYEKEEDEKDEEDYPF